MSTKWDSVLHCWRLQVIANTAAWTWSWDVITLSESSEQGKQVQSGTPQTLSEIEDSTLRSVDPFLVIRYGDKHI